MGTSELIVTFAANKTFTMRGKAYKPGDPIDVTGLPELKVKQLLNQRYLRPVTNPVAVEATK